MTPFFDEISLSCCFLFMMPVMNDCDSNDFKPTDLLERVTNCMETVYAKKFRRHVVADE